MLVLVYDSVITTSWFGVRWIEDGVFFSFFWRTNALHVDAGMIPT